MSYKLKGIIPSTKEGKKLMAVFINKATNRQKTTHFGAKGMSDYSIHKDKERRERYRKRQMIQHERGIFLIIYYGVIVQVERKIYLVTKRDLICKVF